MPRTRECLAVVSVWLAVIGFDPDPRAARAQSEASTTPAATVEEALQRRWNLPFATATSLARVAEYLHEQLHAPVVLDKAALDRLDLTPQDTVQLQLGDVRLRTSLQLLLDQVGMTYRVVPEDNLLILTDRAGSNDRLDQTLNEIRSLRADVRDLEAMVEGLLQMIAPEEGDRPIRKPTIIEDQPGHEKPKSEPATVPARSRAG